MILRRCSDDTQEVHRWYGEGTQIILKKNSDESQEVHRWYSEAT